jgi:hypothetical protein
MGKTNKLPQILTGSKKLEVERSRLIFNLDKSSDTRTFLMDHRGNLPNKVLRTHMHLGHLQNDNTILISNTFTTNPKASFKSENLGPGTILEPDSQKNQYISIPEKHVYLPNGSHINKVPEGDAFIANKNPALRKIVNLELFNTVQKERVDFRLHEFSDDFFSIDPSTAYKTQRQLKTEFPEMTDRSLVVKELQQTPIGKSMTQSVTESQKDNFETQHPAKKNNLPNKRENPLPRLKKISVKSEDVD